MLDMGVDFALRFGMGKFAKLLKGSKTVQKGAGMLPMATRQWEMIDKEIDGWKAQHPGEEFPMSDYGLFGFKLVTVAVTTALENAGMEELAQGNLNKAIARRIARKQAGIKGVRNLGEKEMDSKTINVRSRDKGDLGEMTQQDFLSQLEELF